MVKLNFYMKSGNVILADKVTDWSIKYNDNQITYLSVVQTKPKHKFIAGAIDLKQIEVITESK